MPPGARELLLAARKVIGRNARQEWRLRCTPGVTLEAALEASRQVNSLL